MRFLCFVLCFVCSSVHGQELYFPPIDQEDWERVSPSDLGWCEDKIAGLESLLEDNESRAFIILKDGKIVIESYYSGHGVDDSWYWASAGKSLTAVLTGLAQEDGLLDINSASSDYLGAGWTACSSEQEQAITVKNQLTMTTGLEYEIDDIHCTDPACLFFRNSPGEEWFYHNGPYTLLKNVVASATNTNYNIWTRNRLMNTIGMTGLWVSQDYLNVFFSNARTMARFGLLMLAGGAWDGEQIITDTTYYDAMLNSSQDINPAYGYLWWLNGKDTYRLPGLTFDFFGSLISDAPDDLYAALGKDGQLCMVVPSENLVVVRMGASVEGDLVPLTLAREIWTHISDLPCKTNVEESSKNQLASLGIYPKIVSDRLYIESNIQFDELQIINRNAQVMIRTGFQSMLDVSTLTSGIYFVRVIKGDQQLTSRFIKY